MEKVMNRRESLKMMFAGMSIPFLSCLFKKKEEVNLYHVHDGEDHWYAATSKDEAINFHAEPFQNSKTGKVNWDDMGCYREDLEVSIIHPDRKISFYNENEILVTKTAKEWCEEGNCFVATTVR